MTTNGQPNSDDHLSAYHDGELSAVERAAVEQLLEASPDARSELEDYRSLTELLRGLPADSAPSGLRDEVMRRIAQETKPAAARSTRSGRSRRWMLGLVGGGIAVAAALFLAIGMRDRERLLRESPDLAAIGSAEATTVDGGSAAGNTGSASGSSAMVALDSVADESSGAPAEDSFFGGAIVAGADLGGVDASELAVGDMFSYFEQTEQGEVIVVEATVVDVRMALNQLQVLLNKNSIPTATVAYRESQGFGDEDYDRYGVTAPHGELAVFVESDATRMNAALAELRQQFREESNAFLDLQIAGILDAPEPDSSRLGVFARGSRGADPAPDVRLESAAPPPAPIDPMEARLFDAAPTEAEVPRPAARASVPAEPVDAGRMQRESGATAEESLEFKKALPKSAAEQAPSRSDEPLAETENAEEKLAEPYQYGYQTVLNVSKSDLKRQLQNVAPTGETSNFFLNEQTPLADEATPADDSPKNEFRSRAIMQQQRSPESGQQAGQALGERRPGVAPQSVQRRVRLLVVLESEQPATPALKARTSEPPPPIEAPQPPRGKG